MRIAHFRCSGGGLWLERLAAEMNRILNAEDGERMRVLLASNIDDRDQLASHMERLGAEAVAVADGGAAWSALADGQVFDLFIVDVDTVGLNAAELISFARQQPRTRHLPVIVMASSDSTDAVVAAFDAGAGSVLMKPLNWTVFDHHIDIAMRMVAASRRLRVKAQQAIACGRAKEALLGNVCGELRATAAAIHDEVERIWRAMPVAVATPNLSEAMRRVAREVTSLHEVANRAEELVAEVNQALVIIDRRDTVEGLIERTLDGLELEAGEKGVRLVSDLPADEIGLICDPGALEQALRQIVHNAILYSPSDSNVSVSASIYPDGLLAIDVTDEGEGMHPDYAARCLTPLRTAGMGGVSATGRLGFGLPLAKAIMEAHDGALEIRSMPGEGTTALLILPAERVMPSVVDQIRPS